MTKTASRRLPWWLAAFFPRLRFRLRHGYWCPHVWGGWVMINDGMQKIRDCTRCGHSEFLL